MHTSNQKFHQYDLMHNYSTNNTTNAQVHKPHGKKAQQPRAQGRTNVAMIMK